MTEEQGKRVVLQGRQTALGVLSTEESVWEIP